jgi:short-chain fatty acids transporter
MFRLDRQIVSFYKNVMPSPLGLAFVLTILAFLLAFIFGSSSASTDSNLLDSWAKGLWNPPLMVFAMQMMLMLVLGHVVALSRPFDKWITYTLKWIHTNEQAVVLVAVSTLLLSLFNWGLGLIFGAIYARQVAQYSMNKGIPINYPLIGAAGYSGLMIWHGGFSGSSLIKIAEPGHLETLSNATNVPDYISFDQTVFSTMNLTANGLLLIIIPVLLLVISIKTSKSKHIPQIKKEVKSDLKEGHGLDNSSWFALVIGVAILIYSLSQMREIGLSSFFTPNSINLLLLGLAFMLHRSLSNFANALDEAIKGASGILIQFPLYFGIMGVLQDANLISSFSEHMASWGSPALLPIFNFFSAGIVNIFVPSGGGQWIIQAPIIIDACAELNAPLSKNIMAFAYGDQLTNMLQPFWALPLLAITGLKAKQILPYTLAIMMAGAVVFLSVLALF